MCSHCAPYQFVEFGPAFIDINQVELKSATGMSLSQGIKDLWVYQDDQYLGTFPYLAGSHFRNIWMALSKYILVSEIMVSSLVLKYIP